MILDSSVNAFFTVIITQSVTAKVIVTLRSSLRFRFSCSHTVCDVATVMTLDSNIYIFNEYCVWIKNTEICVQSVVH